MTRKIKAKKKVERETDDSIRKILKATSNLLDNWKIPQIPEAYYPIPFLISFILLVVGQFVLAGPWLVTLGQLLLLPSVFLVYFWYEKKIKNKTEDWSDAFKRYYSLKSELVTYFFLTIIICLLFCKQIVSIFSPFITIELLLPLSFIFLLIYSYFWYLVYQKTSDILQWFLHIIVIPGIFVMLLLGFSLIWFYQFTSSLFPSIYSIMILLLLVLLQAYVVILWKKDDENKLERSCIVLIGTIMAVLLAQGNNVPLLSPTVTYTFSPTSAVVDYTNDINGVNGIMTLNIRPPLIFIPYSFYNASCAFLPFSTDDVRPTELDRNILASVKPWLLQGQPNGLEVCVITPGFNLQAIEKRVSVDNVEKVDADWSYCINYVSNISGYDLSGDLQGRPAIQLEIISNNLYSYPITVGTSVNISRFNVTMPGCNITTNMSLLNAFFVDGACYARRFYPTPSDRDSWSSGSATSDSGSANGPWYFNNSYKIDIRDTVSPNQASVKELEIYRVQDELCK